MGSIKKSYEVNESRVEIATNSIELKRSHGINENRRIIDEKTHESEMHHSKKHETAIDIRVDRRNFIKPIA